MSNCQLEEKNQENAERELENILGITYQEIIKLVYEIHDNKSREGLIYWHYEEFNKEVTPKILDKIKGLDLNFIIYI